MFGVGFANRENRLARQLRDAEDTISSLNNDLRVVKEDAELNKGYYEGYIKLFRKDYERINKEMEELISEVERLKKEMDEAKDAYGELMQVHQKYKDIVGAKMRELFLSVKSGVATLLD